VGKCGTSSLYYYLNGHPEVVGASSKQIQWFDHAYAQTRFRTSYLGHFPKKLAAGRVTGEASPGYAQYSNVPGRVALHLPGVRILVIARDPAERAFSSYHYNYVTLAKDFSLPFEVLVDAEIAYLRDFFARDAARCDERGCRVDLSADCYGARSAERQAGAAARAHFAGRPAAVKAALPRANQHLWRQLVGRSLYVANLDWWYAAHAAGDILLVCSEDLGAPAAAAREMARVAAHVGLAPFDFGPVVAKGKYNAGPAHHGYEAVTAWGAADHAAKRRPPMDPGARRAVDNFTAPFNARLFDLAKHTCAWGHGAGGRVT